MFSAFNAKRSSGFDFRDQNAAPDIHPDLPPTTLQRNKTERRRLQGLMRADTVTAPTKAAPFKPNNFAQRWQTWMVNEGGRRIFFGVFLLLHILVGVLGALHYSLKSNLSGARATFGSTFVIARSAALILHVDVIFILLPICRNFISILRRTPLNDVIPFDKNITFHKAVAWSIVIFSGVHIAAHMVNYTILAEAKVPKGSGTGKIILEFIIANFTTGPGITGWIMTVALGLMVWFAMEKRRRRPNGGFEWFYYIHYIGMVTFFVNWQLHGMFCMIQPDTPPYCSYNTIGVFWRYWLVGGLIFISERVLREVRSRHHTYISKIIQHPSNVMEVQIKKEKTTTRAGQYIFLSCPEVSYWQWHISTNGSSSPFTLTSAPEEDYISVHIRVQGDFTTAFAKALGCDFSKKERGGEKDKKGDQSMVVPPPLNRTLPRVMVDGPFGSASEDFFKYETVLLVGAGIGVTPFASILKTIWYRLNDLNHTSKRTRLSKVYFTWVIRDFGTAEWFHSLLHAIEEQDVENKIEISIYLTAKIKQDDMTNIMVQDVGAEQDAITHLRAPTHFGRPNWDRVFSGIADRHPDTDVGVFFCGPAVLSKTLHVMSNKYTTPKGTRFFFGKENF
ncbi:NADPH oxidase [Clavulina sp. PMI_390]|nr:NADPH oxidase [Clavulina sp. PMI_390]